MRVTDSGPHARGMNDEDDLPEPTDDQVERIHTVPPVAELEQEHGGVGAVPAELEDQALDKAASGDPQD